MGQNENRTRVLLLIAIVVTVALSIVLHLRLAEKRAASKVAANDPGLRAAHALQDADRATVNHDYDKASFHLDLALKAVDEGLVMRPGDLKLSRNRLILTRRMAQVVQKRGRPDRACRFLATAVEQATALFAMEPTNSRMRGDRLATAREWAEVEDCPREKVVAALRGAAEAVDTSAAIVPTTGGVRMLSARTWLELATLEGGRGETAAALGAGRRALALARARADDEHDPISAASAAYGVVGSLVELAAKLDDAEAQIEFERAAIAILEVRANLSPDDITVRIALGARRGRLADFLHDAGDDDAAERLHQASIVVLKGVFGQKATDTKIRQFLVRSLSRKAAFYSGLEKNSAALALYAEAATLAAELGPDEKRSHLIALGNHAQLLGRLDHTRKARKVAATAYTLALELAGEIKASAQAKEDAVSAGLRYARLLRAAPGANRRKARGVARAERSRLRTLTGKETKRRKTLGKGLGALLTELR